MDSLYLIRILGITKYATNLLYFTLRGLQAGKLLMYFSQILKLNVQKYAYKQSPSRDINLFPEFIKFSMKCISGIPFLSLAFRYERYNG
jgi:hypothetical protein